MTMRVVPRSPWIYALEGVLAAVLLGAFLLMTFMLSGWIFLHGSDPVMKQMTHFDLILAVICWAGWGIGLMVICRDIHRGSRKRG